MDFTTYITQIVIFAIASFLHGIAGMSFPMIGTTSLALEFPLPKAIAMIAFPSLIMNVFVLLSNNQRGFAKEIWFYIKTYRLLILSSIIGSIVGIKLLIIVPAGIMYIIMSLVILFYVASEYLSQKGLIQNLKVATDVKSTLLFGFLAGVVGGSTNAMAPILMMYLFSKTDDKHEIVKSSNICYLFGKLIQIVFLGQNIISLNNQEIVFIILITLISIFFLFLGIRFRRRVSNRLFKNVIYIILLTLSIKVGMSGMSYFIS